MWYGILLALVGGAGGTIVAFYYRYKYADQRALIVGLEASEKSLKRDIADRDVINTRTAEALTRVERDHADAMARKDQILEARNADVEKYRQALVVLQAAHPDAVVAGFGELFAPPDAHRGEDGDRGEDRRGARRP